MMLPIVLLLLIQTLQSQQQPNGFRSNSCSSDQVYVKIVKKTNNGANEESFRILAGSSVVYSSPSLSNYNIRTFESCLAASPNRQYTLQMEDSGNDSWSDGAYLVVYGENDNPVLRMMMSEDSRETVPLSLYAPINKYSEWRFSSDPVGSWKGVDYEDDSWTLITPMSTSQQATGTQYLRKLFAGLSNMASIELALYYRYGIVAYINGEEVYRDNMPGGAVSTTTQATGSYSSYDYRGVYRSAAIASESQSILAVELHSLETLSTTIRFDAYVAFGAGISPSNNCYVAPVSFSYTSTGLSDPEYALSLSRSSYSQSYRIPATLDITSEKMILPMVSSIRVWPGSAPMNHPSSFSILGLNLSTGNHTELYSVQGATYSSYNWTQFDRIREASHFSHYRIQLRTSQSTPILLNEIQFLVCNRPIPTAFSYPKSAYVLPKNRTVELTPTTFGFTSCSSRPSLPSGLLFHPSSCTIHGVPMVTSPQTVYTITAAGDNPGTAIFSLTILDCASVYRIVRTYKTNPQNEYFRISDPSTEQVIYQVNRGHSHPANQDWTQSICINSDRFDVTLFSSSSFWTSESYLFVYYVLSETEEELVLKARFDNFHGNTVTYSLYRPSIAASSDWLCKMGTVPTDWYSQNANTTDWSTGSYGLFPDSTNGIQLYRKTFTIDSLSQVKGVVLSLRYKYGCVVYMNGYEAFRNGVSGMVSTSSSYSNTYSELKYRVITLPGKTVPISSSSSIQYLIQGSNVIAIAIVSPSNQVQSLFDAVIRLMPAESESHIWEYSVSSSYVYNATNAFDMFYDTYASCTSCYSNEIILTLNNDRREWVTSVEIQNFYAELQHSVTLFALYGRNTGSWVLLTDVSGLIYLSAGQKKRIYFSNNIPYNQFKFVNLKTGNSNTCMWKLMSLNLYADNTIAEPSELVYPASSVMYKDIEIEPIIPLGQGYSYFQISPSLPSGLRFDPFMGWIAGTPSVGGHMISYQITATKMTGGSVTVKVNYGVRICGRGKSLITFRYRTDSYRNENSWKLFAGRGTQGTLLQSVTSFPSSNAYYYVDFCRDHGIYTLQSFDSNGDGWQTGSGYTMMVDDGDLELEIEELRSGYPTPLSVTTVFSTFLPFQIDYTDWKVWQRQVPVDWMNVSFNDTTWMTRKAIDIPSSAYPTTYLRKSFQLTNATEYRVLNVRMKYSGGVAVYYNGNRVGRFNLEEEFGATTESILTFDSAQFSKFHIVLATAGIREGVNVVAFEIHYPAGSSAPYPVVFDATGVFGLNDCSTVVDSYSSVTSSYYSYTLSYIMDLNPYTVGSISRYSSNYVEWTVENLEGSKWNSFNILGSNTVSNWGFDVKTMVMGDSFYSVATTPFRDQTIYDRRKPQLPVSVAMAGFRTVRWEVMASGSSSTDVGSLHVAYCIPTGSFCEGMDDYPPVKEGEHSYSACPEGYRGYAFRICSSGQLGPIQLDFCKEVNPVVTPTPTPTPLLWFPIYDPFILGDNCNYEVQETCYDNIIPDMVVLGRYLDVRDAYPTKALKHTRVIALSGMTLEAVEMFHQSLSKQVKNPAPVDMYFYSDYKIVRYVDATMAVPLISLAEFTRPSRILFGDGSMKREGMAAVIQWMVDNRDKGYFVNLEYFQISGHKAASFEGTEAEAVTLQNQIVTNLHTMCTDKTHFPKLRTLNFNSNAYNEFSNGFDAALINACSIPETSVTILASHVALSYPSMCSTNNAMNYWYYNMTDDNEIAQCRFNWNWEVGDVHNVYAPAGPFPNDNTLPCESLDYSITHFSYPSSSYVVCKSVSFATTPVVHGRLYSFSVQSGSLPSGLSLNFHTGSITGIPSMIESSRTVVVRVQNPYSSRTDTIGFSYSSIPSGGFYGVNWNQTLLLQHSLTPILPDSDCPDCTYSAMDTFPAGLLLDPETGRISGNVTQLMNDHRYTIRRTNACGSSTDYVRFTVIDAPSIVYSISYVLGLGEPVTIFPTRQFVDSVSILSGSLPTGLSLNHQTGAITGSPLQSLRSLNVTLQASNSLAHTEVIVFFKVVERISQFTYPQSSYILDLQSTVSLAPQVTGACSNFTVASGSLPNGLSLNARTGVISGTTLQSATNQWVTVKAENDLGTKTVTVTFTVVRSISTFHYPKSDYLVPTNVSFSISPTVVGEAIVYSVSTGPLPLGLSLNTNTGVIAGIPSRPVMSLQVTMKAQNGLGSKTTVLVFTVVAPITSFSYPHSSFVIAQNAEFSTVPSTDAEVPIFSLVSGSLPQGLHLNATTGRIYGTPNYSVINLLVTIKVENVANSKTVQLSFTVILPLTTFTYSQSTFFLSKLQPIVLSPSVIGHVQSFSITSGSLPVGLELNESTGSISGSPSENVQEKIVTVKAMNALGFATVSLTFTVLERITLFSYPAREFILAKNESVSIFPDTSGDDVVYSIASGNLPTGLSLHSGTGTITGFPSSSVTSFANITIMARNALGNVTSELSFKVLAKPTRLSYPQVDFSFALNDLVSITPYVNGDLINCSLQKPLPDGLSFYQMTGAITGTTTTATERTTYKVTASNEVGSISCYITIAILTPISSISYPKRKVRMVKGKKTSLLAICDGDELDFSISNGALPDGLTLDDATGEIAGVPTKTRGKAPVTIRCSNAISSAETTIYITVSLLSVTLLVFIIIIVLLVAGLGYLWYSKGLNVLPVRSLSTLRRTLQKSVPNKSNINVV